MYSKYDPLYMSWYQTDIEAKMNGSIYEWKSEWIIELLNQ